ncbi:MAG: MBL fold metallo-hydrolase [Chlamydiia bacterium]
MNDAQLLGCGASMGVPVIGCRCAVCTSRDPRNQRLRSSMLVRAERPAEDPMALPITLLVDCGPDFRAQALRTHLDRLDAVLITHAHMDHIGGIDDLRAFTVDGQGPLPLICHESAVEDLRMRHHYMLQTREGKKHPQLTLEVLHGDLGEFSFAGETIQWITFDQMGTLVVGYRLGDLAYITDMCEPPERLGEFLQGVQTLVLSALQRKSHAYFLSVAEAVALAQQWKVPRTILTHLSHDVDAVSVSATLPPSVELGYDGLAIEWSRLTPRKS